MTTSHIKCPKCHSDNSIGCYFCDKCGSFLHRELFDQEELYKLSEVKLKRIVDNLSYVPHSDIAWDGTVDQYCRKVEQLKAVFDLDDLNIKRFNSSLATDMMNFLDSCREPKSSISCSDTGKTGKSTFVRGLDESYKHILEELKGIVEEKINRERNNIQSIGEGIPVLKDKIAKQKVTQKKMQEAQQQLQAIQERVKNDTQVRMNRILSCLNEEVGSLGESKKKTKKVKKETASLEDLYRERFMKILDFERRRRNNG